MTDRRSGVLQRLASEITDEDMEYWKQKRIKHTESLTLEYQLGYFVGSEIVNRHLPTLSTDSMRSGVVIQVSEEDTEENTRLDSQWFESTRYGNNRNPLAESPNWDLFHAHNKMLDKKYMPDPLVCRITPLNVQNWGEFKEGLIECLWDCDMCSYSLKPEDIEISDDEGRHSTIIKFKLDASLKIVNL